MGKRHVWVLHGCLPRVRGTIRRERDVPGMIAPSPKGRSSFRRVSVWTAHDELDLAVGGRVACFSESATTRPSPPHSWGSSTRTPAESTQQKPTGETCSTTSCARRAEPSTTWRNRGVATRTNSSAPNCRRPAQPSTSTTVWLRHCSQPPSCRLSTLHYSSRRWMSQHLPADVSARPEQMLTTYWISLEDARA